MAMRAATRKTDIVARLGGDEFGILCVNASDDAAAHLNDRLVAEFRHRGISASIGYAMREHQSGLRDALRRAVKTQEGGKLRVSTFLIPKSLN